MLSEFFTNHVSAIFLGILICLVLSRLIASFRKTRKEKPDPPFIFGPIRGMYVCYQCDTVFNTPQCPVCDEQAVIPLIHLTGSVIEDQRVAAVLRRLQEPTILKLSTFKNQQAAATASESRPESANGGMSEVPVVFSVFESETGQELS